MIATVTPNILNELEVKSTSKTTSGHSNLCPLKTKQLENCFNEKMDALIEMTEKSKNRIALLASHNKTKRKEVENEYEFLKKVGEVCKKSCDYYFETNIKFHESCVNFNTLFNVFSDSLSNLIQKNKSAEEVTVVLKRIEEKETEAMLKEKEECEQWKGKLEDTQKKYQFMTNESENLTNKIKETDYQINQHREAFESFFILSNINIENISQLEKKLEELKKEQEVIAEEIREAQRRENKCVENVTYQKTQLESQKEQLTVEEKERQTEKANLLRKKNEIKSNSSIIESQFKFLENQILSQEYYLNVITSGFDGNVKRKEEIEEKIERVDSEVETCIRTIIEAEEEQKKTDILHKELKEKVETIEKEIQLENEKLIVLKKEESILNKKLEKEKQKLEASILDNLKKEHNCLEAKIKNYKEEIKALLSDEKKKKNLVFSQNIDTTYKDNTKLIKNLESILEELKKKIKEEQEQQWKNEREIEKINIQIKELREKVEKEKQKVVEMDLNHNTNKGKLEKLKKKNADTIKMLANMKKEKKQRDVKYNTQNEEVKKAEKKLEEINKNIETNITKLQKQHEENMKKLYSGKTKKIDIDAEEKKQMKEEVDNYVQKMKEEYEMKKKKYEQEFIKQSEEECNNINEELTKKEDLIQYYKELLSKSKGKDVCVNSDNLKFIGNEKKGNTMHNVLSKKKELTKLHQHQHKSSGNRNGTNNSSAVSTNGLNNNNVESKNDTNSNTSSSTNSNISSNTSTNNNANNINRFKLYNIQDYYKIGYFDMTSPILSRNLKTQNNATPSPHITRLLKKLNKKKDAQPVGDSKKNSTNQEKGNNKKSLLKGKSSNKFASFDLFQHY